MARRKKVKKSTIVKIVVIVGVLVAAAAAGVIYLRKYVSTKFADNSTEYSSAKASVMDLSTRVSGTGSLSDTDIEEYEMPDNVEIDEVVVEVGDKVTEGQTIAKINTNSVLAAMYEVQHKMDEIDSQLQKASEQKAATTIKSTVKGRVKAIYVTKGSNVINTMTEKNALMILSLDGYMKVEIDAGDLTAGKKVSVEVNGKKYKGTVKSVAEGKAKILITDNGTALGADAKVTSTDGKKTYGTAKLEVNSPLSIVSYAGKVTSINVKVNQSIKKGKVLMKLNSTSYTANYDKLIKERADLAEDLADLLKIYNDGAILARMSGTIKTVPSTEDSEATSSSSSSSTSSSSGYYGYYGSSSSSSTTSTTTEKSNSFTICPDKKMTIEVSVDETDILSISKGQSAEVTIDSLEQTFTGTITDIDKSGTTSDGTVGYTAEITIDKVDGMLSGMSASVLIAVTEYKNSIVIPVEALNNTGSSYFVYTTYDEETKQLGGMVEVKLGIQNDTYAQITEGLQEGDEVWYKKAEENPFEKYMNRSNGNRSGSGNNRPQGNWNGGSGSGNRPQGGPNGGYNRTGSGRSGSGSGSGNRTSRRSSTLV
ncbi:MAG: HlyD family efflux transporter periplasmic adaptor subunit [Clostridiales bacterium]|nr:HlyD family efflux transporter periplasmic adaptor subunit [Clostridiales bacterium]